MKSGIKALAFLLAISLGARADGSRGGGHSGGDSGLLLADLFLEFLTLGVEAATWESVVANAPAPPPDGTEQRTPVGPYERAPAVSYEQRAAPGPYEQRADDDRYWSRPRRQPQAREGLLISFGIGGGSMFVSNQSPSRIGAFDVDFRLGYGFSDRFQFFMDVDLGAGSYNNGYYGGSNDLANWTVTFRGQTVLIGDRAGNGLNLNLGVGLGGITRNSGYADQYTWPTGLALAGGLSYDARLSPWFALSPEFFYTWHQIPNDPGAHDVASIYGLRLNFLWYLH